MITCQLCKKTFRETLTGVEKRTRPGCQDCCSIGSNRLSDKQAIRRFRAQRLTPLETYPGRVDTSWKVRCDLCSKPTRVKLTVLEKRLNPGCATCGSKAQYRNAIITPSEAGKRACKAELTPVEPYPNDSKATWVCRCVKCGTEIKYSLNRISTGPPGCRYCAHRPTNKVKASRANKAMAEMRANGVEPLTQYPGADAPWHVKCMTCKKETYPRISSFRSGQGSCKYCSTAQMTAKRIQKSKVQSLKLMRKSGFEPISEYKGATRPWKSKCVVCSKISSPSAKGILAEHGCRHCAPNAPRNAQKAKRIARQANREYLEPFKGASTPIRMRCTRCGNEFVEGPMC